MPDSPSSPASSTPTPEREQPGEGRVPSWRVDPAPDGRGAPPQQRPPLMPRNRRGTFIGVLVALLAVNFILAIVNRHPAGRTPVPSQPVFLQPVRTGNVQEISSTQRTIERTLEN